MYDLPLYGLRALAGIYREGGVRACARSMDVSPSAVHSHLRELEARVGTPLTVPRSRPLELTETGLRLARVAGDTLDRLATGFDVARQSSRHDRIAVSCTESFASSWLISRLNSFTRDHPHYEIWLRPSGSILPQNEAARISIRMGDELSAGAGAIPLLDDQLVPVAATGFPDLGGTTRAQDLATMPLLHDFDMQAGWEIFARAHGCNPGDFTSGSRFGSSRLLVEAAAAGIGIALARRLVAADAIAKGTLVSLDHLAIDIGPSYWLSCAPGLRASERAFRDWLVDQSDKNGGA